MFLRLRMYASFFFIIAGCAVLLAQEPEPAATIPSPLPLRVEGEKLSGAGAEALRSAVRGSQFVAVGEDHGFNEIPRFVEAIWGLAPFDRLLIEVGPITGKQLERMLRQPNSERQFVEFEKQFPASVPFYNWKPEFDLLEEIVASRPNAKQVLIGLDQEFIMSPGFLLTRILDLKPSAAVRAQAEAMLKANDATVAELKRSGKMDAVYMFSAPEAEFAELAELAKGESPDVRRIIDQLVATHQVYADYNAKRGYVSNRNRAQLMKRNLVDALGRDALARPPRLLLKFGAFHMFRGMNPLNSAELGNFVSEWAEGMGLNSTHILVLGKKGTQSGFAGLNDQAHKNDFDAMKEKQLAFVARFMQASPEGDWSVFDLRPLRPKVREYEPGEQRLILGYDFLVVIPAVTAATAVR